MPYNGYDDGAECEREAEGYWDWLEAEFWIAQTSEIAKNTARRIAQMLPERWPASYRTKFIPELKDVIMTNLANQGISSVVVAHALEVWDKGEQPRTPAEARNWRMY
jgi:hypothetical protein